MGGWEGDGEMTYLLGEGIGGIQREGGEAKRRMLWKKKKRINFEMRGEHY